MGDNEVTVTGPAGWGIRYRGRELVLVILLVIVGLLGYGVAVGTRGLERIEHGLDERGIEHRELLCLLALPIEDRVTAVRSGSVCRWLLGTSNR